jgi:Zn-dependent membrane protease YugP
MPFGFFGFDPTFLLLLPAMAFAMWAQHKVRSTYEQFSHVPAANGFTGRDMASAIMTRNSVDDVRIEAVGGVLSDHYDPRVKVVRLSADNYGGRSIASIAVAAHEVGHVLQHHQRWLPLALRSQIAPVAGFGSTLAMPLFIVGLFFGRGMPWGTWLMDAGIVFFAAAVLFHLVTLPVEFDASRRAKAVLGRLNLIAPGNEAAAVSQVLNAAAWTYVAAFVTSLLYFLWHLLPLLSGRQRD